MMPHIETSDACPKPVGTRVEDAQRRAMPNRLSAAGPGRRTLLPIRVAQLRYLEAARISAGRAAATARGGAIAGKR